MIKQITKFLAVCICMALTGGCSAALQKNVQISESPQQSATVDTVSMQSGQTITGGYRAALYNAANNTFLVAGTDGRLDRIDHMKQVQRISVPTSEDLLCTGYDEKIALFGGTNGTILYTEDGQAFKKAETGVATSIFGITAFKGKYFAGSEQGLLLTSDDGIIWKNKRFEDKKDIISIASTSGYLVAITRDSDIYVSKDGLNWSFQNFNNVNNGLYDPYDFKGIRTVGSLFAIFGNVRGQEDAPLLMLSEPGDIWSIKPLSEIDVGNGEMVPVRINSVVSDLDQILTGCDLGRVLTVTDCYKCNIMSKFSENNIRELIMGNGLLLIVGDNFEFDLIDPNTTRQYDIVPEQAYSDATNGAVIIDVRSVEEYNEKHIKGSIHIPVDQIEQKLPERSLDPMTELIFYCSAGQKSQTALETAQKLGYEVVYNLGSIDDWPYETE